MPDKTSAKQKLYFNLHKTEAVETMPYGKFFYRSLSTRITPYSLAPCKIHCVVVAHGGHEPDAVYSVAQFVEQIKRDEI